MLVINNSLKGKNIFFLNSAKHQNGWLVNYILKIIILQYTPNGTWHFSYTFHNTEQFNNISQYCCSLHNIFSQATPKHAKLLDNKWENITPQAIFTSPTGKTRKWSPGLESSSVTQSRQIIYCLLPRRSHGAWNTDLGICWAWLSLCCHHVLFYRFLIYDKLFLYMLW